VGSNPTLSAIFFKEINHAARPGRDQKKALRKEAKGQRPHRSFSWIGFDRMRRTNMLAFSG
jgi:hypothetical protein